MFGCGGKPCPENDTYHPLPAMQWLSKIYQNTTNVPDTLKKSIESCNLVELDNYDGGKFKFDGNVLLTTLWYGATRKDTCIFAHGNLC